MSTVETTERFGRKPERFFHTIERTYCTSDYPGYPVWFISKKHLASGGEEDKGAVEAVDHVVLTLLGGRESANNYTGDLPFGLIRGDDPEVVQRRLGRPEGDSINKDGNGWLTYQCGIPTLVPVDAMFSGNKLARIRLYEKRPKQEMHPGPDP